MLDTRVYGSDRDVPRLSARQAPLWRHGTLVLMCLIAALCGGCPEPIPLHIPSSLPANLNVPQAQHLLKEALLRALHPEILEVDVSADFLIYRYRLALAVPSPRPLTEVRIALLNIGRVEAYTNNVVLIWTPSNVLLGQLIFGNYQDPKTCANMLLFLRDQRAQRG